MRGLLIPPDLMWQDEITGIAAVFHSQWTLSSARDESRIGGQKSLFLINPKIPIKDDVYPPQR